MSIARQPPLSHAKIFPERPSSATKDASFGLQHRHAAIVASFVGRLCSLQVTYAGTVTARAPVIPQLQCFHVPPCASMCLHVPPLTYLKNPPNPLPRRHVG